MSEADEATSSGRDRIRVSLGGPMRSNLDTLAHMLGVSDTQAASLALAYGLRALTLSLDPKALEAVMRPGVSSTLMAAPDDLAAPLRKS